MFLRHYLASDRNFIEKEYDLRTARIFWDNALHSFWPNNAIDKRKFNDMMYNVIQIGLCAKVIHIDPLGDVAF